MKIGIRNIKTQAYFIGLFLFSILSFASTSILAQTNPNKDPLYAYFHHAWPLTRNDIQENNFHLNWSYLEDKTLIFSSTRHNTSNDKTTQTIYSLKQNEDLASVIYKKTIDGWSSGPEIVATLSDRVIFISRDATHGSLIATDGTIAGTDTIYQIQSDITLVDDNIFRYMSDFTAAEDELYFTVVEYWKNRDKNNKTIILRTDGLSSGTDEVVELLNSEEHPTRVNYIFKKDNAIYFTEAYRLWKVETDKTLALIHEYDPIPSQTPPADIAGYLSPLSPPIITSNGAFHCSANTRPLDAAYHEGLLWKLSNNDNVGTIAVGCTAGTLFNVGDRIFYINKNGLWYTDGTLDGELLIYAIDSNGAIPYSNGGLCVINDDIYITLTNSARDSSRQNFVVKISPDNSTTVVHQNVRNIIGCLDDGLILQWDPVMRGIVNEQTYDSVYEKQRFYFDISDNSLTEISGLIKYPDYDKSWMPAKSAPDPENQHLVTRSYYQETSPYSRATGYNIYYYHLPYYISTSARSTNHTVLPYLFLLLED